MKRPLFANLIHVSIMLQKIENKKHCGLYRKSKKQIKSLCLPTLYTYTIKLTEIKVILKTKSIVVYIEKAKTKKKHLFANPLHVSRIR